MPVSEFNHCKNPLTARASFYLDSYFEDVGEEYGYSVSCKPSNSAIEDVVVEITFIDYKTKTYANFFLLENGNIVKIKSQKSVKTGNKVFNDDIQILDEIETLYEVEENPCGQVQNFIKACENVEGFENIACQAIMIIEDAVKI